MLLQIEKKIIHCERWIKPFIVGTLSSLSVIAHPPQSANIHKNVSHQDRVLLSHLFFFSSHHNHSHGLLEDTKQHSACIVRVLLSTDPEL